MDGRGHELLERNVELELLERLAQQAREGHGALMVIEGPAGIGKTALTSVAATHADAAGLRVLRARGGELERGHPFGVARQLFESVLTEASDRERARLLSGTAGAAAPALGLGGEPVDQEGVAVRHGLFRLCAECAQLSPLMLAIDDVHWSDPATLRWLVFLAARIQTLPVALVIATRPPEGAQDAELVMRLLADPAALTLRLHELSEQAVARLARESWTHEVDAQFVAACRQATGGNPFLLCELLAECHREGITPERAAAALVRRLGPATISRSVLLRLGTLGEPATAVARAVAVLGTRVPLVHAAALAGVAPEQASQAADALAAAGILASGRPLDFIHPIIRTVAYGELAVAERSRQHARAAQLLEQAQASVGEIAAHLAEIEPAGDQALVERLRAAAASALSSGSPEGAVRFLERALAEPPAAAQRARVLFELGRARSRAGSGDAIDTLREALSLCEDPRERAQIALELLPLVRSKWLYEDVSTIADGVAADLDPVADRELRLTLEAFPRKWDFRAEVARLERYRDLPGATRAERLLLAVLAQRLSAAVAVSASEAAELATRALPDSDRLPVDTRAVFDLWGHLGFTFVACDRVEVFDPVVKGWLRDARRLGLQHWLAVAVAWRGACRYLEGDLPGAEVLLLEADEMRQGAAFTSPEGTAVLVMVRLARGDVRGAELVLASGDGDPDPIWAVPRAALKLVHGDLAAAADELLALGSANEEAGWLAIDIPCNWRATVAAPLARLGRADEARELLRVGLQRARKWGVPRGIGQLLHASGVVEEIAGGDGVSTLEEAVGSLALSRARLDHAAALVDLGAALRRTNRRAAARPRLREGLELARACGAAPLVDRALQELEASGARPRNVLRVGVESLTPSERRVVQLASEGRSNADIGQTLFVSVKTVETHLGHAYQKLGVRSRHELKSALAATIGGEAAG